MNTRTLVILSLSVTACNSTPTLPGEWDGKTLHAMDGSSEPESLPYEECSTMEGNSEYCTTMDFYLEINDDFTGVMTTQTQIGEMELALDIEPLDNNAYNMVANVMGSDEMSLYCVLYDSKNMTCGFALFGFEIDFEKQ